MPREKKLPKKLSDLIDLALNDLNRVERLKGYRVDMFTWHEENDGVCSVCLAGSVMAGTLRADKSADSGRIPNDYSAHNWVRLEALDEVRRGNVCGALRWLEEDCPHEMSGSNDLVSYDCDRTSFKRGLRGIARELRKHGL